MDGLGLDRKAGVVAVMQREGGPLKGMWYQLGMLVGHTTYKVEIVGILLGLYMISFKKNVSTVRLTLDNQAIIAALDMCKSGSVQYLTDEILHQTQTL